MIILIVVNRLKVIYDIGHQKVIVLLVYIKFGGDSCYKSCPKQIGTGGPLNSGNAKKKGCFPLGFLPLHIEHHHHQNRKSTFLGYLTQN